MKPNRPKKQRKEYVQGEKALENFEKAMKAIFRASKPKNGKD